MKQLVFSIGLATALATGSVSAQDVVVDDFERDSPAPWTATGFATISIGTDGGADSTQNYLNIADAGWAVGADRYRSGYAGCW